MAFDDNFAALAVELKKPTPRAIGALPVTKLTFIADDLHDETIEGNDLGAGARLFFERELRDSGNTSLVGCDTALMERAETYFAEFWNHRPGTGTHKVIDALKRIYLRHGAHVWVDTNP